MAENAAEAKQAESEEKVSGRIDTKQIAAKRTAGEGMDDRKEKEEEIDGLVDIRGIRIDPSLPAEERIQSFLRQIRNPSLFRYKDLIVEAVFAENGDTLKDRLEQYGEFFQVKPPAEGDGAYGK